MNIFEKLFANTEIPELYPVKFSLPCGQIHREQIDGIIRKELQNGDLASRIKPGMSVAITAGSREITDIDQIVRTVVDFVKECKGEPFVFPAMGSHGGATAEGQLEVLAGYGITEETMGCPIYSSMETVHISDTASGLPVHIDSYAAKADAIIPIGRIKPHTDFHGKYESGLMKMMTIGLGKQYGANLCHSLGMSNMPVNIEAYASEVLRLKNVIFGVGIIEDAFHTTYKLSVIPGEEIKEKEPALLQEAKSLVPCIPFQKIDVLVLDEIGKDISGAGMDPNVTGRSPALGISQPFVERIAVLDLTDKSHNNGSGIGNADVTTRRFYDKFNMDVTYPNCITSHDMNGMKIPAVMPNDRLAIKMALNTCIQNDSPLGDRMVWMKNTLHLDKFYVTKALLPEVEENPLMKQCGDPVHAEFDAEGNVSAIR